MGVLAVRLWVAVFGVSVDLDIDIYSLLSL